MGFAESLRAFAKAAKTVVVAGVGFFTDSYDLFVMNMLNVVFKRQYGDQYPSSQLSTAALVGAIVGQLSFGFVADYLGRRMGLIITTLLLILGALLSAVGYWGGSVVGLFWALTAFRFILGVGIGGEYPCAATVAAEAGDSGEETVEAVRTRGRTVLLVFSMQGMGNLAATGTVLLLVVILGESNLEAVWRVAFGVGAIPVIGVLYSRLKLKDSNLFNKEESKKSSNKMASWALTFRLYKWRIFSTAATWFLWDIVYYSNGLFSSTLIQQMAGEDSTIKEIALCQLLLVVVSLPGYYVAAYIVDKPWIGRIKLQFGGLIIVGLLHCLVGGLYGIIKEKLAIFVSLYALVFFFYQCGPNSSSFVIPAEVFPTAIRARAHGFSAACGKAGAALGALFMMPLIDWCGGSDSTKGPMVAFIACGALAFLTAPLSFLVPEMACQPLHEIDDQFYKQLELDSLHSTNNDEVSHEVEKLSLLDAPEMHSP